MLAPSPKSRGFLTINAGTLVRPLALQACRRKRSVPLCLFSTEQTGTVRLRVAPSPKSRGFLTINAGTLIRPLALQACRRQAKRPALPLQHGANRDGLLTLAPSPKSRGVLTINGGTLVRPLALQACRRKRSVPLCLFSTEQTGTVRLRWHRPRNHAAFSKPRQALRGLPGYNPMALPGFGAQT